MTLFEAALAVGLDGLAPCDEQKKLLSKMAKLIGGRCPLQSTPRRGKGSRPVNAKDVKLMISRERAEANRQGPQPWWRF